MLRNKQSFDAARCALGRSREARRALLARLDLRQLVHTDDCLLHTEERVVAQIGDAAHSHRRLLEVSPGVAVLLLRIRGLNTCPWAWAAEEASKKQARSKPGQSSKLLPRNIGTPPTTGWHLLDAEHESDLRTCRRRLPWIEEPVAGRESRDVELHVDSVRHRGRVDSPISRLVRHQLLAKATRGHPGRSETKRRRQTTVQQRLDATRRALRLAIKIELKKRSIFIATAT